MQYFILFFAFLLAGCATTANQSEEQTVQQLTISQNYSGLVEVYKSKVIANSQDWESQQLLAEAYLSAGDIESADFYIQRVLDLSGKATAEAHLLKGKILAKRFDFETALNHYSKAIGLGLNSADLYMHRGIALAQTKRYEIAIDSFNLARLRGFDEVSVKNNIAMVHIYQGDFQSAVDILLPVYEQDSSNSKVSSNLKLSLMKLEEQEAVDDANDLSDSHHIDNQAEVTAISAQAFFEADAPINDQPIANNERRYYIQLGAYDTMSEALEKRNELLETQLPIAIRTADLGSSGIWYRLLTGEFKSYRQARSFVSQNRDVLDPHDYFIQVIQ